MTLLRNTAYIIVGTAGVLCVPTGLAQTDPRTTIDISAGASVETNPFLFADGETAGAVFVKVDPRIYFEDELGQTVIESQLRLTQYTNRYGAEASGQIGISSRRQVSERLTVNAAVSAQSSRSPVQDALLSGGDLLAPETELVPDVSYIDSTIAGTRSRVTSLDSDISLQYGLDPVSSIGAALSASYSHFEDDIGDDFSSVSGQANYSRRLSERTSLTLSGQARRVDYIGQEVGDSTILSPRVGIRQQLSSTLSWTLNAGVDFVDTDRDFSGDGQNTYFSGSAGLCNQGLNEAICVSAERSARPTALGGVAGVTTFALNYDRQLSQTGRLSLAARYGRTNQSADGRPDEFVWNTDIVAASASYSHELSDRLSLFVTPSYTKIFDDTRARDANLAVMAGVSLRLGRAR